MESDTQPTVEIDVIAARVTLRGGRTKVVTGQWVSFYALLALRADARGNARFLTAEELGQVGRWQHKSGKSVGKEVSRHLGALAKAGIDGVLGHEGKTRRWRIEHRAVVFLPDRAAVARWLSDRMAAPAIPELGPLANLVQATLDLNAGRTEEAMDLALGTVTEGPYDAAWRALVAGRAAQRTDEGERLPIIIGELHSGSDPATKAASARLSALVVYNRRFAEPRERLDDLRGLAGRLEADGDVGSLASVLNVMGLLERRAGRPSDGAAHLRRACALFGLCGDVSSLQASLFNLALCRIDMLSEQERVPDDGAMDLIDLCLVVCATFGVGRDSAQAEITGCRWALARGELARARNYLEAAERIVEILPASFEQACFLRARAEFSLATGGSDTGAVRDLRAARRMFEDVDDLFMAARIAKQISALEQGR